MGVLMEQPLIPLAEGAHRLSLSWGQAWRLLLNGSLQGEKVRGRWMVSRASVDRLARERADSGAAA